MTRIGADVGGTFTDLVLHDPARGLTATAKLPTTPSDPARAVVDGVMRLLAETGTAAGDVTDVVHGTTLITNALLERTGARTGLITTGGFRDIVEMRREIRYDTADLHARPAPVLVPRPLRLVVPGRVTAEGSIAVPLDGDAVLRAASYLVEDQGIESLAIGFLHSYANPAHELEARDLVSSVFPGLPVTLSAQVAPEIGEYERFSTACVNAYVQPVVRGYLDRFASALADVGVTGRLSLMLSSGGLTTVEQAIAYPVRLLESGPAAGALAAASVAARAGERRAIAFDMGGTTAKMCLVEDFSPRVTREFEAARADTFKPGSGLPLRMSAVDLIEIGTGGGSVAFADAIGLLKVGPRSAGSVPGPVCYGRGGVEPTVTDADVLCGQVDPAVFEGEVTLDAFGELGFSLGIDVTDAVAGVLSVVSENMAAATRMHLAEKGQDPRTCTLIAFGGAGPVHAYALAKRLKVPRVIVPAGAGVLSAFGFLVAAPAADEVRGYPSLLSAVDWKRVGSLYAEMWREVTSVLGPGPDSSWSADIRYAGQGYELTVPLPDGPLDGSWVAEISDAFADLYAATFGRVIRDAEPEVISWRLSARRPALPLRLSAPAAGSCRADGWRTVYFDGFGRLSAGVYERDSLAPGAVLPGPLVVRERDTSCAVGPDATVTVSADGDLVIDILDAGAAHD
jgi:N-methylhydantoinase A